MNEHCVVGCVPILNFALNPLPGKFPCFAKNLTANLLLEDTSSEMLLP